MKQTCIAILKDFHVHSAILTPKKGKLKDLCAIFALYFPF